MRTHPDHVRRGVGTAILEHIIAEARRRGVRRLSLETGSGPAFDAALALYRRHGFVNGGPFDYYTQSEFNQSGTLNWTLCRRRPNHAHSRN